MKYQGNNNNNKTTRIQSFYLSEHDSVIYFTHFDRPIIIWLFKIDIILTL